MTELDELIAHWKTTLATTDYSKDSYTREIIKATIRALEELKKLKGEE